MILYSRLLLDNTAPLCADIDTAPVHTPLTNVGLFLDNVTGPALDSMVGYGQMGDSVSSHSFSLKHGPLFYFSLFLVTH